MAKKAKPVLSTIDAAGRGHAVLSICVKCSDLYSQGKKERTDRRIKKEKKIVDF